MMIISNQQHRSLVDKTEYYYYDVNFDVMQPSYQKARTPNSAESDPITIKVTRYYSTTSKLKI